MFSIVCLPTLPNCSIDCRIVLVGCLALQHAARAVFFSELRILRIVRIVGLFLGIEMVEVSEELVEAVYGRQVLVAVAEVVLPELASGVAEFLRNCATDGSSALSPSVAPGARPWSGRYG